MLKIVFIFLSGVKIVTDMSIRARYDTYVKDLKVIEDTGECQYIYLYVSLYINKSLKVNNIKVIIIIPGLIVDISWKFFL